MQKPGVIKVFGVLNILLASLGILGGICGVLTPFFAPMALSIPELASQPEVALLENQTVVMLTALLAGVGLLTKGLLLISGVGLVNEKAWSVKIGNVWAVLSIVLGAVGVAVNVFYVMPLLSTLKGESFGAVEITAGIISGILFAWIYPGLYLMLMNRAPVRAYLARPTHQSQPVVYMSPQDAAIAAAHDPLNATERDDPWNDPRAT